MLGVILCLSFIATTQGRPYDCKIKYAPSRYIGFPRVPTNCLVTTPSACPRSWKSGIPDGRATTKPLIHSEFLICHEGFSSCGYVPINPRNGEVLGHGGVTIGSGIDLASKSASYPGFSALPNSLIGKLEPYFGLRKDVAACVTVEQPLQLYPSEAFTLTNVTKDYVIKQVAERYNRDKAKTSLAFASLPRAIRTAITSVWFQVGEPKAYQTFWKFVKENNWERAARELRRFYKNPSEQMLADVRRRNDEADIMEATLVKCKRSLDAVVLLDASGSVSPGSFAESLDFVKNLTAAFSDEKLRARDGTRFGLSTFSHTYSSHFFLSSYASKTEYLSAISGVTQDGGTTSLGYALTRIAAQFSEEHGLRNEERGIPRILIVLTDGKSHDAVEIPARLLRQRNIVIHAIGIGQYDKFQLRAVASSRAHVHTLNSFFELDTFIATLTAATCNEPRPVPLAKKLFLSSEKQAREYFVYKASAKSMLKINVQDRSGQTSVYVSRTNPHPYKYDNDMGFDASSQKNKTIVVAVKSHNVTSKRSIPDQNTKPVYVSVLTSSKKASFTIEGNMCNPLNCSEGTNENEMVSPLSTATLIKTSSILAFVVATSHVLNIYC